MFAGWDALYRDYTAWNIGISGADNPKQPFPVPVEALARLTHPDEDDVAWLRAALKGEPHQPDYFGGTPWFVSTVLAHATSIADVLLEPLLDAGVEEVDPSYNRRFIEPCTEIFGVVRVRTYLAHIFEYGSDFQKAGAVNALYWAMVPFWPRSVVPAEIERQFAEYQAARAVENEALGEVHARLGRLMVETFIATSSIELRRSLLGYVLPADESQSDPLRPLRTTALEIAQGLDDKYIQSRLDRIFGRSRVLPALPHRQRGERESS
jgi:hypothetical protein